MLDDHEKGELMSKRDCCPTCGAPIRKRVDQEQVVGRWEQYECGTTWVATKGLTETPECLRAALAAEKRRREEAEQSLQGTRHEHDKVVQAGKKKIRDDVWMALWGVAGPYLSVFYCPECRRPSIYDEQYLPKDDGRCMWCRLFKALQALQHRTAERDKAENDAADHHQNLCDAIDKLEKHETVVEMVRIISAEHGEGCTCKLCMILRWFDSYEGPHD